MSENMFTSEQVFVTCNNSNISLTKGNIDEKTCPFYRYLTTKDKEKEVTEFFFGVGHQFCSRCVNKPLVFKKILDTIRLNTPNRLKE